MGLNRRTGVDATLPNKDVVEDGDDFRKRTGRRCTRAQVQADFNAWIQKGRKRKAKDGG